MTASRAIKGKTLLITGGTGSFGNAFLDEILARHEPAAVRVYSRDELKQYDMQRRFAGEDRLRYLLGDVRDLSRLRRALQNVDVCINAAALKQVPACEYNPFEAVQTNIVGAENVVTAAIDNHVGHVLHVSTDKAVNPANLYGATKLCAEKIVVQGNAYAGRTDDLSSRFSCVRYGNVVGSRGSVVPLFKRQAAAGELTITHEDMTRFWITLPQAVQLVVDSLERMEGGETFVPRIPSMRVTDLAEALAPGVPHRVIGIRPGEKIHETLLTGEESRHATAFEDHYAVYPAFPFWRSTDYPRGDDLPFGFNYSSDANDHWLSAAELSTMIDGVSAEA